MSDKILEYWWDGKDFYFRTEAKTVKLKDAYIKEISLAPDHGGTYAMSITTQFRFLEGLQELPITL